MDNLSGSAPASVSPYTGENISAENIRDIVNYFGCMSSVILESATYYDLLHLQDDVRYLRELISQISQRSNIDGPVENPNSVDLTTVDLTTVDLTTVDLATVDLATVDLATVAKLIKCIEQGKPVPVSLRILMHKLYAYKASQ